MRNLLLVCAGFLALFGKVEAEQAPRVGVACVVLKEGKVLLGKRKGSHAQGVWGMPGGHLEFGETVEDCAKRELWEETGLTPLSFRLGPWVENQMEGKHYITVFVFIEEFEGELITKEPDKCTGWTWFNRETLPSPLFSPILSLMEKEKSLLMYES